MDNERRGLVTCNKRKAWSSAAVDKNDQRIDIKSKSILKQKRKGWFALIVAFWTFIIQPVVPAYAELRSASDNATEQVLAGYAQQAGTMLSSNMTSRQAQSQAMGMLSGAATAEIQSWLSSFGNVRVKLDVDRHFSLKNSEFEMLLPWYDYGDGLFFTQHSIHRTDGRLQMNHGLGYRYFTNNWMMGANSFFDHDLSDYHSRLGLGLEARRDYVRFAANSYLGLSGWRYAPDATLNTTRYDARPADGWDLRAEGWLPKYPHLGGTLRLEQYYGREVALFGLDNRLSNPMALTTGLSWTPIPMLSFSAERGMVVNLGGNGEPRSNFSAGLQLTYRPGMSFAQQIDPDLVGRMRTLAGSRYDLVERNNNIILEYREQGANGRGSLVRGELSAHKDEIVNNGADFAELTLHLFDENDNKATGHVVTLTVDSIYASFPPVPVSAPVSGRANGNELNAQTVQTLASTADIRNGQRGGAPNTAMARTSAITMVKVGPGEHKVRLATTTTTPTIFTVTASVDGSTITITPVTVAVNIVAVPDLSNSQLIASPNIADVGDSITVTLTLNDAAGNAVNGYPVVSGDFAAVSVTTGTAINPSSVTPGANGTYVITFEAETAGEVEFTYTSGGNSITSNNVTINVGTPDLGNSTLIASPSAVTPGETITVILTLRDAAGNPISNSATVTEAGFAMQSVMGSTGTATVVAGSLTSGVNGTYTIEYTAVQVGDVEFTYGSVLSNAVAVEDRSSITLVADPTGIMLAETSTIRLTLADINGLPVTGQSPVVTLSSNFNASYTPFVEASAGVYEATLSVTGPATGPAVEDLIITLDNSSVSGVGLTSTALAGSPTYSATVTVARAPQEIWFRTPNVVVPTVLTNPWQPVTEAPFRDVDNVGTSRSWCQVLNVNNNWRNVQGPVWFEGILVSDAANITFRCLDPYEEWQYGTLDVTGFALDTDILIQTNARSRKFVCSLPSLDGCDAAYPEGIRYTYGAYEFRVRIPTP